jgi:hypothetical protein
MDAVAPINNTEQPADVAVLADPRLLIEDDIPWMYWLAKKRYSPRFDLITTEGWMRNVVLKQPLMFLPQRTEHAFCVSMLSVAPWLPSDFETSVVLICADEQHMWEALKLMRASIEWAKARQCKLWRVCSETDADLTMLAKRVGAEEISPRFVIRF